MRRSGISGALVPNMQRWRSAKKISLYLKKSDRILLPNTSTEALDYYGESSCQNHNILPPEPQPLLSSGEGHSQSLPQQVQSSRKGQGGVPVEFGFFWPTPA